MPAFYSFDALIFKKKKCSILTECGMVWYVRSPDTARIRNKMIYASSKDRFKRELDGIQVELQATDPTEMGLDVIKSRAY